MDKVKGLYGPEPMRQGEYPMSYTVGFDGVTRIETGMREYGDHGIEFFSVYKGDDLHSRVLLKHLAEVQYFKKGESCG